MARIHVDIDDTIADSTDMFLKYLFEEHKIKLNRTELEFHNYAGRLLKNVIDHYREFEKSDFFKKVQPINGAMNVINNLSKKHELIIISGRPKYIEEETKEWLSKFFSSCFSDIYLVNQYPRVGEENGLPKYQVCKNLGCILSIDDDPNTAQKNLENGIDVLLFDQPWNKYLDVNGKIKRVFNWGEINNILSSNGNFK